jgi:hypothetical protein
MMSLVWGYKPWFSLAGNADLLKLQTRYLVDANEGWWARNRMEHGLMEHEPGCIWAMSI